MKDSRRGSEINIDNDDFVNVMSNSSSNQNFEGSKSYKEEEEEDEKRNFKKSENEEFNKLEFRESSNLGHIPVKRNSSQRKFRNRTKSVEKKNEVIEALDYETNPRDNKHLVQPEEQPIYQLEVSTPKKEETLNEKSTKKKDFGNSNKVDYNSILEVKHNKLMKSKHDARVKLMNDIISKSKKKPEREQENPFKLDKKKEDYEVLKPQATKQPGGSISPPKFNNVELKKSIDLSREFEEKTEVEKPKKKKKKKVRKSPCKRKKKRKQKYSPERDIELQLKYPSLAKAVRKKGNLSLKIKSTLYENLKNFKLEFENPVEPPNMDSPEVLLETERSENIDPIAKETEKKEIEEKLRADIMEELNRETPVIKDDQIKQKTPKRKMKKNSKKKKRRNSESAKKPIFLKRRKTETSKKNKESSKMKKRRKKRRNSLKVNEVKVKHFEVEDQKKILQNSGKLTSRSYTSNSTNTFRDRKSPNSVQKKIQKIKPEKKIFKEDDPSLSSFDVINHDFYASNPKVQLIDISPSINFKPEKPIIKEEIYEEEKKEEIEKNPKIKKNLYFRKKREEIKTKNHVVKRKRMVFLEEKEEEEFEEMKRTVVDKILRPHKKNKINLKSSGNSSNRTVSSKKKFEMRQRIEDSVERLSRPKKIYAKKNLNKSTTPHQKKNLRYSSRNSLSSGFNTLNGSNSNKKIKNSKIEKDEEAIIYIEKRLKDVAIIKKQEMKILKKKKFSRSPSKASKGSGRYSNKSSKKRINEEKFEPELEFKIRETEKLRFKRKEKKLERRNDGNEEKKREREHYIQSILDKIETGIEYRNLKKQSSKSSKFNSKSSKKGEKRLVFKRPKHFPIQEEPKNPAPFNTEKNSQRSNSRSLVEDLDNEISNKMRRHFKEKEGKVKSDFNFDDIEVVKKTEKKELDQRSISDYVVPEEVKRIISLERSKILGEMNRKFIEEMKRFRQKR